MLGKDLNITCEKNLKPLDSSNKLNKELLETNVKLLSKKNEITIGSFVITSCDKNCSLVSALSDTLISNVKFWKNFLFEDTMLFHWKTPWK